MNNRGGYELWHFPGYASHDSAAACLRAIYVLVGSGLIITAFESIVN